MRQETIDRWKHSRHPSPEKQERAIVVVLSGLAVVLVLASLWMSFG